MQANGSCFNLVGSSGHGGTIKVTMPMGRGMPHCIHSLDSFIGSGHFCAMSLHKFLQRLLLLRLQLGLL